MSYTPNQIDEAQVRVNARKDAAAPRIPEVGQSAVLDAFGLPTDERFYDYVRALATDTSRDVLDAGGDEIDAAMTTWLDGVLLGLELAAAPDVPAGLAHHRAALEHERAREVAREVAARWPQTDRTEGPDA